MPPKRDFLLHRNYYFLRIKQATFILLSAIISLFIIIKNQIDLPREFQAFKFQTPEFSYGVTAVVVLLAFISLRMKQGLLFLFCTLAVYLNTDDSFPPVSNYARISLLAAMGLLCLFQMELRYNKENFGLTLFPPGWGTLNSQVASSAGRFLSLWELAGTHRWKPGGIRVGRPLPEQRLLGLFNFVRVGPPDDRHFLTIAGNRSGKGTAAIIPNLLLYPGSAIVIDPKGELAKITAARRGYGSKRVKKYLKQDVFVFDPESIVSGHTSACWNPLADLELTDPNLWAHVEKIATTLIPQVKNGNDANTDYFRNHARTLLTAMIVNTLEQESPERHNLIYIRKLIMEGDDEIYEQCAQQGTIYANAKEALFDYMAASTSQGGKIARAAKSFLSAYDTEKSGILGTLQEQTNFLDHPALEKLLMHSDFSLKSLKERPTTIYLCLKATSLATPLAKALSLFIDSAIVAMESVQNRPKYPVLFIMDEFYVLGRNETLDKAMGLVAGFGVTLWPILQHIGQLKEHYPNTYDNFIRNCRGIQLFGEQAPETLKWVEDRVGTKMLKRSDGTIERVPLISAQELASDYFFRESRRQVYIPTGRPAALLELMDYYLFFSKNWYNDLSDYDIPNPNPKQIIKLPAPQPAGQLPSSLQNYQISKATGFSLNLSGHRIYKLHQGMQFTTLEIPELHALLPDNVVAKVVSNPSNPAMFGIQNLSNSSWTFFLPDGSIQTITTGKSVPLMAGRKLNLGHVGGVIISDPLILNLSSGHAFALTDGQTLKEQDIPGLSSSSTSDIVGEVCRHPNNFLILGLKNKSNQTWNALLSNGNKVTIVNNKSLVLAEGTQIDFGQVQGEVSS